MALQRITIPSDTQAVSIEIAFSHGDVGTYSLYLWNADRSQRLLLREGISSDAISDRIDLTPPNGQYDGRILDCIATVIEPDPGPSSSFSVDLIVRQGANELGRVTDSGPIGRTAVVTRLAAELAAA